VRYGKATTFDFLLRVRATAPRLAGRGRARVVGLATDGGGGDRQGAGTRPEQVPAPKLASRRTGSSWAALKSGCPSRRDGKTWRWHGELDSLGGHTSQPHRRPTGGSPLAFDPAAVSH
jgi:hypothetical protein